MKTHLLASLCLIAATTLSAREFTDLQGRKLDAELVAVAGGQATLKRASDGRSFTVPAASFSADDQKFMKDWADQNAKYNFEVKYTKKKMGETKQKQGVVTVEDERWIYKIEIKNRMPVAVGDLRVDYWCFRREDGGTGKGGARIETSGSSKVSAIPGSSSATVDTTEIVLHKEELRGDYYYIGGNKNRQADGMGGLVVRIFDKNDREVHKYATKDDLLAAAVGKPSANGSSTNNK
ncbi:hypothetical protein [Prosthecobacter sp.]|uniref:hypothetical protein n=1 Tax=Prosthecobacter sp. TaxID=1965333 RepID=UPI002AB8C220|nr:hypothetical protein [Prosthecobacter sp.]MDZ4402820.1 hypothetical protein [Prosthecobacter sp.]